MTTMITSQFCGDAIDLSSAHLVGQRVIALTARAEVALPVLKDTARILPILRLK